MSKERPSTDSASNGLSRRSFLGLVGLSGAAVFLAGCENQGTPGPTALPDAIAPASTAIASAGALVPGEAPAAPIPTKPLQPPVAPTPPHNNYGIIPRSMWARGGPDLSRIQPMDGVKLITFHHSGDPKPFWADSFGETAQHLEYVREYHRSRNFQDIGYHFAIDRMGRVWQLRSLKYEGQHVRYNNEHNVGVVVLGNFDLQPMTSAQMEKARIFGALLRKQYALPISRVFTHQEIVSTECPGRRMQPYMVAIRRERRI